MATSKEIQDKREGIEAMRDEIRSIKQSASAYAASADADHQMEALEKEERSVAAQLKALRDSQPKSAAKPTPAPPAPASTKPAPAGESKE